AINIQPNGTNINDKCGAAATSYIQNNTVALDGDGDRIILKDKNGNLINGDIILMFLAEYLNLPGVVGTVMTNQAVATFCEERKLKFFRTDVGDKFVRFKMDKENVELGGETSGHIILDSLNFTGDGFAVYLKVTELLNKNNLTLEDLNKKYVLFPQKLINITVKEKLPFSELKGFSEMMANAEKILKEDGGRIFPRYSGTENYLRILLETKSKTVLNKVEKVVIEFIETLEEK
ncbi:MAG: phosphoglucosamine mutase, partial [Chlorobi bacterium]|nr:phosphoglucosamine mutase [Chlorobiota bacterium]